MVNSWGRLALGALLVVTAACSDGSRDGSTVGGRTRSVSTVAATDSSAVATLRLVRTRELGVPGETGSVRLELVGTDDPSATARFPGGAELPLLLSEQTLVAERGWQSESNAAAGSYTALWHDSAGARRALTLIATGESPAFAELDSPAAFALLEPEAVEIAWRGADYADVCVERVDDDAVVVERLDVASPLTLPPLDGARRYRLTLTVARGRPHDAVRWESRLITSFDTTQGASR